MGIQCCLVHEDYLPHVRFLLFGENCSRHQQLLKLYFALSHHLGHDYIVKLKVLVWLLIITVLIYGKEHSYYQYATNAVRCDRVNIPGTIKTIAFYNNGSINGS